MTAIQFLVEWALRSSILIVCGALLLRALRVKDPSIRLAAWTAMLASSLVIPALTAALPKLPLAVMRAAPVRVEAPVVVPEDVPRSMRAAPQPNVHVESRDADLSKPIESAQTVPAPEAKQPSRSGSLPQPFHWARAALMLYVLVAFALLLRLCFGLVVSLRLLRRSRATGEATEGIEIRESDRVTAPVALGIVRPAIVLPTDWRAWDSAKLSAVLAHEHSHIRRHDPAVQLLSAIHRALLWHTPLSWFLHRQIVQVAEEVCDDAAVAATRDRTLYAEVLLDFMRRGVWRANWQGVPMARYGRADKRIHRILDGTALSRGVTRWSLTAILALGLPLAYLAACARPQTAKKPSPAVDAMAVGRKINAGDFHLGRGEYDDAIASYQDGLRLDRTNAKILLKLINAIKSCQKEEHLLHEGLSCGATRNVIHPSPTPNPATSARITIGDFYLGRAEYDNAIASYEEGLKLDPFNAEIPQKLNTAIERCNQENSALNEGLKCGAGGPGIAPAAIGGQDLITTIIIRGNVVIPVATVRKSISINAGEVYDPAKIDRDVTALKNTGYFDDVRVETSPDPMGTTVVIFYVHEKKDAAAKQKPWQFHDVLGSRIGINSNLLGIASRLASPQQRIPFPWERHPPATAAELNLFSTPNFAKFGQSPPVPTLNLSDPFKFQSTRGVPAVIPQPTNALPPQTALQPGVCSIPLLRMRVDPSMKFVDDMDSAMAVKPPVPSCDDGESVEKPGLMTVVLPNRR